MTPERPRRTRRALGPAFVSTLAAVVVAAAPAAAGDQPTPPPPAEVREQADEILRGAEFDEPGESLLDRAFRWLAERIDDLFEALGVGGVGGQGVLGWIALALLGGVVAYLLYRLVRADRGGARVQADGATTSSAPLAPTDWLAAAEEAEAEGRWRVGLRCRYRSLVASLEARDVLDEIPGRTSGEHRLEVAERAPEAAAAFAGAAELFERAWYGNRPTGEAESVRFRALADQVLAAAARPERRRADELDLVPPR